MRKVCSIILVLLLTLAVAPCYASEADTEAAQSSTPTSEAIEAPVQEETPATTEISVPEETPALAEAPASEENPVAEESPTPEENPVAEESPAPEENLVTEESPVAEENPASTDAAPQKAATRASTAARIYVTVPSRGNMIINPYKLPIDVDGRTTTEQIAGETLTIYNNNEIPVSISANARGLIYDLSNAVYASTPPAAGTQEKQIFVYAEFQDQDDQWTGRYIGASNQILISTQVSGPREVLQLDPYSEGVFRLFGSTAAYPDEPWDRNDKIVVQLAFTFSTVELFDAAMLDEEQVAPVEPSEEPSVEETPEMPAVPETPEEPETPEVPETPVVPETPEEPETPVVPETPEDPDTPVVPETPEDPDTPAVPETPEEPETPAVPETPEEPETPAVPETPEEPETPVVPELPEEPEIPEAETPEEPVTPEGSETPEEPETP